MLHLVLTFSDFLFWEMGLIVLSSPVHKLQIDCDWMNREVAMGVLSIGGLHVILGNNLTCEHNYVFRYFFWPHLKRDVADYIIMCNYEIPCCVSEDSLFQSLEF